MLDAEILGLILQLGGPSAAIAVVIVWGVVYVVDGLVGMKALREAQAEERKERESLQADLDGEKSKNGLLSQQVSEMAAQIVALSRKDEGQG